MTTEFGDGMDISQLRAALAESLHKQEQLQNNLDEAKKKLAKMNATGSPFLDKLPIEVRRKIYQHLLVNPALSEPTRNQHKIEDTIQFGLAPEVLRTCRQINTEASEVLYGRNRFYFRCYVKHCGWVLSNLNFERSALARYFDLSEFTRYDDTEINAGIMNIPSLLKVRHWNIEVCGYVGPSCDFQSMLKDFCRAIAHAPPKSLSITFCSLKDLVGNKTIDVNKYRQLDPNIFLSPLKLLSNVEKLEFNNVSDDAAEWTGSWRVDTWGNDDCMDIPPFNTEEPFNLSLDLKTDLICAIQGSTPASLVFEMYDRLLAYAKTFERYEPCKSELHTPIYGNRILSSCRVPRGDEKLSNPYKYDCFVHPLEDSLCKANLAANQDQLNEFVVHRKEVLDLLEAQYQRMMDFRDRLIEFIKQTKAARGVLDPDPVRRSTSSDYCVDGVILLEDFSNASKRDMPHEFRRHMRKYQHHFDEVFQVGFRETYLNKLSTLVKQDRYQYFYEWFIYVVQDILDQCVEIREARKALYDFDITENYSCDIDLEMSRLDETIDWTVTEPPTQPCGREGDSQWL